jgi:phosphoglycolate phosphatase-like HAD superfamily hydrolase|tara:strand:- start:262 stop:939 length:678 start_codon:yes stop_codon:yes gene_type:complete
MAKIKAIGFDFDDTLILSEKEKADIFEEIFYRKYKIKKGVKKAYIALLGTANRKDKIRKMINKFLRRAATKQEVKELSYSFSKGYEYKLSDCPLVQCTNMLTELKKQVKFMFLLSLENRDVIIKIVEHCGIAKYFDEVLGGPKSKLTNFKHLINKHGVKPEETIYIGDSKGDIIKSKKLKFKSIGIQKKFSYKKLLKNLGADFTFSSLCEIPFKHLTHEHLYTKK